MPTIATEPIIKEIHVDAQPETVFAFFTEADKLTRWLAAEAATDPRPGGIFHQTHRLDGVDYLLRGEFVEVDPPPPRRLHVGFRELGDRRRPGHQHRRGDADTQ